MAKCFYCDGTGKKWDDQSKNHTNENCDHCQGTGEIEPEVVELEDVVIEEEL
jgi:DnaJ-class molecular chaperone